MKGSRFESIKVSAPDSFRTKVMMLKLEALGIYFISKIGNDSR